jgi:hypothetical protein
MTANSKGALLFFSDKTQGKFPVVVKQTENFP